MQNKKKKTIKTIKVADLKPRKNPKGGTTPQPPVYHGKLP